MFYSLMFSFTSETTKVSKNIYNTLLLYTVALLDFGQNNHNKTHYKKIKLPCVRITSLFVTVIS